MAKQGQHQHDKNDNDVSRGHNNPDKSVTITTGSSKKQETYEKQAAQHKADNKEAQADKNEWIEDTRVHPNSEDKALEPQSRNGSQSDESKNTRGY